MYGHTFSIGSLGNKLRPKVVHEPVLNRKLSVFWDAKAFYRIKIHAFMWQGLKLEIFIQ